VFLEHLDYHAALKLEKTINGKIVVKSAPHPVRSPVKKRGSPVRKKRKIAKNGQKDITSFFTPAQKS